MRDSLKRPDPVPASILDQVARLAEPAPKARILRRVFVLLQHYYVRDISGDTGAAADVQREIAEDWYATLAPYPAWAIDQAARWWISSQNPMYRHKPLPGDIGHQCWSATGDLRAAEIIARRQSAMPLEQPQRARREYTEPTPQELENRRAYAAQVMAELYPTQRAEV